jgi:hypothetical protein
MALPVAPQGRRNALVRRTVVGLVALASFGSGWPAQAATYYVDRSHPAASDANPGSEALPWLTIQHAADTVVAGDTVYIKAGTYNEAVTVQNSGAAGNPIVYSAYPGHSVTVDGNGISFPGGWGGLVDITARSHIRVTGLRIANSTASGILAEDSSFITIDRMRTFSTESSGIGVWGCSNVIIDRNEVELANNGPSQEHISVAGTEVFQVSNNLVHHGGPGGKEGICIKDGSSNGRAFGNHVHHVARTGLYVDAWDKHTFNIEVFGNLVHDCAHGMQFASEQGGLLENLKIYDNVFFGNQIYGIQAHDCCSPPPSHPVQNVEIVNNTLYNNGLGGWGPGIGIGNPEATGLVIRNNVLSQNNADQIEVVDEANVAASHNLIDGPSTFTGADPVLGSPLFVDAAGADFHLQRSSPGIDSGTPLNAPRRDYDGVRRPLDGDDDGTAAYDIGAYELPPSDYIFGDGFELGP